MKVERAYVQLGVAVMGQAQGRETGQTTAMATMKTKEGGKDLAGVQMVKPVVRMTSQRLLRMPTATRESCPEFSGALYNLRRRNAGSIDALIYLTEAGVARA